MTDSIFILGDDGVLTSVSNTQLQELLAGYVDLLPGAQVDRDSPRRWQLVRREAGSWSGVKLVSRIRRAVGRGGRWITCSSAKTRYRRSSR